MFVKVTGGEMVGEAFCSTSHPEWGYLDILNFRLFPE